MDISSPLCFRVKFRMLQFQGWNDSKRFRIYITKIIHRIGNLFLSTHNPDRTELLILYTQCDVSWDKLLIRSSLFSILSTALVLTKQNIHEHYCTQGPDRYRVSCQSGCGFPIQRLKLSRSKGITRREIKRQYEGPWRHHICLLIQIQTESNAPIADSNPPGFGVFL